MISVIIPVYNVEPYLRKCLDSVIGQTYRDLEILVIDDGSTDGSGKICDEYAGKDDRIKVFHTENKGLSAARNLGLDNATGEWIGFVDSDDWIEPDMYEVLLRKAEETGADVVECGYYKEDLEEIKAIIPHSKSRTGVEAVQAILEGELSTGVWSKLWKNHCFDSVHFTPDRVFEDVAITYRLFLNARRIDSMDLVKYHWFQRKNSLSKSHGLKSILGFWASHRERYEVLRESMEENIAQKQLRFCASAAARLWAYFNDFSTEDRIELSETVQEINTFSKRYFPVFGCQGWGIKLRIGAFFTHYNHSVSFRIARLINRISKTKDKIHYGD